jgi:aryl carrier-like protein
VEEKLAAIWQEVLGVTRVGVTDNFFALGGDSILSLQVIARARAKAIPLEIRHLFQHHTIAEIAEQISLQNCRLEIDAADIAEILAELVDE